MSVKIYNILFDALPLTNKIVSMGEQNKLVLLRQIGSCFTNNSIIQMLTGVLPSDLRDHGMGHLCHNQYRDKNGNIKWPWESKFLFNIFNKNGWRIRFHNSCHYSNVLSNNVSFERTTASPDDTTILNTGKIGDITTKKEKEAIRKMQSEKIKKNKLYLVRYTHYHISIDKRIIKKGKKKKNQKKKVAIKKSIELMKSWNFEEPNAIFWIWSDHGDWNSPYDFVHPIPQNYLSWSLVRDNTKNPIKVKSQFISLQDFFVTMMKKFDHPLDLSEARSIADPQQENRIFYVEDGRKKINEDISTLAMACKFVDWKENKPRGLSQVSYFKPDKKWVCKYTSLDKNGFDGKTIKHKEINTELKEHIKKRFNWV